MKRVIVPESARHIIAMGGAFGYDTDAGKKFLRYMLRLTGKRKPRIMFLGTASGDADYGRIWFYKHLTGMNCVGTDLRFFEPVPQDLHKLVLSQDAIFAGGGNSKSLLAIWREYGFDLALKNAWEHGVVLGGASAGGLCWFDQPVSLTSWQDKTTVLNGLSLAAGSVSPHYDSDPKRRPTYRELVRTGQAMPGIGIDENAALHVVGSSKVQSLAGAPNAACYRVSQPAPGQVKEEVLPTIVLR